MPAGERPQERLERLGASALSDTELLALLVRSGTKGQDVLSLSSKLISEAGTLAGLLAWHEADFRSLRGIGRVKALQLVAAMEVARRAVSLPAQESPVLNRADLIADYVSSVASGLDVEKFWVLCLNRRNRLRKRVEVSSGTATAALAHPREVFRSAIREAASAVVCVHNHPSGVLRRLDKHSISSTMTSTRMDMFRSPRTRHTPSWPAVWSLPRTGAIRLAAGSDQTALDSIGRIGWRKVADDAQNSQ
jgi:DNA repair protein RadC